MSLELLRCSYSIFDIFEVPDSLKVLSFKVAKMNCLSLSVYLMKINKILLGG